MNIFILDTQPRLAASYLCDKHCPKMVLETAQILCSPFEQGVAPYRRTHYNHPCCIWARESQKNYFWLLEYGYAVSAEYRLRYGRTHKSEEVISWCANYYHSDKLDVPHGIQTPFALCMPDEYKKDCPVESYRAYYRGEKAGFAKWKKGVPAPEWW